MKLIISFRNSNHSKVQLEVNVQCCGMLLLDQIVCNHSKVQLKVNVQCCGLACYYMHVVSALTIVYTSIYGKRVVARLDSTTHVLIHACISIPIHVTGSVISLSHALACALIGISCPCSPWHNIWYHEIHAWSLFCYTRFSATGFLRPGHTFSESIWIEDCTTCCCTICCAGQKRIIPAIPRTPIIVYNKTILYRARSLMQECMQLLFAIITQELHAWI